MENLLTEVLINIFEFLDQKDLEKAARVSRR
jgi:hypothetical protein